MVSLVSTEVSFLPSLVSSSTEVSTSVCTTPSSLSSSSVPSKATSWPRSLSVGVLLLVLVWLLTLLTPSDGKHEEYSQFGHLLIFRYSCRRMMMTSGAKVHYKSMFDAGSQIIAAEGVKSLFKGAGANILRGVAGAGVLSLYDKMQELVFGKVYSGGA